ncbi:choice-of-anchor H family protein [Psychrobium sp. nBUS_13]|uniref:choice-of-anchor H family protein n=1 Tax=Psychrobium sp. nBUS_13 TaxID=3395319 RepID=UPI003EBF962A
MRALILFTLLLANSFSFAATSVKQQAVTSDKATAQQSAQKIKKTSRHNVVWLDSLTTTSLLDEDNDGYSQDINFTFDFDTSYQQLTVYVDLMLVDEQRHTTKLTTSSDFALNSDSLADKQRFDITVDEHLLTGYYQLLINIYDANNHQLIDVVDYRNNQGLDDLRLEGHKYDHHDTFSLFNHFYNTSIDQDNDGYDQRVELTLDLDSLYGNQQLQANIRLDGRLLYASAPFTIYGSSTSDVQTFDLLVPSQFHGGTYALTAEITQVSSHHSEHTTTFDLGYVSVESDYNDQPIHTDVIIHDSGCMHWLFLFGAGAIAMLRRYLQK